MKEKKKSFDLPLAMAKGIPSFIEGRGSVKRTKNRIIMKDNNNNSNK